MTEEKVFPANYRKSDDTIQTVEEHLKGVSNLCENYAQALGFGYTGKLLGLLHDMGKYTDEFYEYVMEAIQREKEEKEEKEKLSSHIDHGRHGARFVLERYHNGAVYANTMTEILAMIICYHHGGLEDYMSDDLDSKLLKRCGWPDPSEQKDEAYAQAYDRINTRVIPFEQLDEWKTLIPQLSWGEWNKQ